MISTLHFFGVYVPLKSENRIKIKYNTQLTQDVKTTQCDKNKQNYLC